VIVVDRYVLNAGVRQRRNHGGLPDALGQPGAARAPVHEAGEPVGERVDLAHAVAFGNDGEHGLHVAPAEHLDLTPLHHVA